MVLEKRGETQGSREDSSGRDAVMISKEEVESEW